MMKHQEHRQVSDYPSIRKMTNGKDTVRREAHACERCRSKHRKCKFLRGQSACMTCTREQVECARESVGLRIRFSKFSARIDTEKQQALVENHRVPPTSLSLQSPDGYDLSTVNHDTDVGPPTSFEVPPQQESSQHIRIPSSPSQTGLPLSVSSASIYNASPTYTNSHSPSNFFTDPFERSSQSPHGIINGRACLRPLSLGEVQLVKHFFASLVSWFDYCDPEMHFRSYLGSHISSNAGILYAILALSARHLEVTQGRRGQSSQGYERQCLEQLIPSLNDTNRVLQDTVLVSALLLRLLEEMTPRLDDEPHASHHVSIPVLMQIKRGNIQSSGTSEAAMIVALRQEIFLSNIMQRSVEPVADYCNIDNTLEPASDAMWTNRIIAHAAKVTSFIYGDQGLTVRAWDELWGYIREWDEKKPASFRSLYNSWDQPTEATTPCSEGGGHGDISENRPSFLPSIYYSYDCPAAAEQYAQLCRILLLANDPRSQHLGLGQFERAKARDEEIRRAVRIICGIGTTNSEYRPNRSNAGMVVAMCGELFTDPGETRVLLDIITEAEVHLGWPCLKASQKLHAYWDLHKS